MAPAADPAANRHPSIIQVAKSYVSQSDLELKLNEINMGESKDDMLRLQGVAWIDSVRRSLQLPIRTFNTAAVYFHRFRLRHPENEYNWADAAAAALFTACKIEDTLKKSRDILCANYNLKLTPAEQLAPDDQRFEAHSKLIIGLERLMLEASAFDFRNRYPQKLLVKLCEAIKFDRATESKTAWHLSLDLYRTFAPLKQSTPTMAIACVELAARLHRKEKDAEAFLKNRVLDYKKWSTSRQEVMETLLDLLDLYTHYRTMTDVGPLYSLETFLAIRIHLNQEASAASIPRYATYTAEATQPRNGKSKSNGIAAISPISPSTPSALPRGHSGAVRFMLDATRAQHEHRVVEEYYADETEEYDEVVEIDAGDDRGRDGREHYRGRDR